MARKFRNHQEYVKFLEEQKGVEDRGRQFDDAAALNVRLPDNRPAVGVDLKPDFRDRNAFRSLAGAEGIYLK